MKRAVSVPAYAKVNLFLDVVGKRPDGYHSLVTLFERIDLADRLTVELTGDGRIECLCDSPQVPVDGTNLAVRAAFAYRQATNDSLGIRIQLKKQIPVAAGLGGGSSDAAATLLALQQLSSNRLSEAELDRIARQLGSDVPFFLAQRPWALGRGRGEELEPVTFPMSLWHLLVYPNVPISTRAVYQAFTPSARLRGASQVYRLSFPRKWESDPHFHEDDSQKRRRIWDAPSLRTGLTAPGADVTLICRALRENHVRQVEELLFNALEPTVEALYPVVREVKATIRRVTHSRPLVSGSGSTVLALCATEQEAQRVAQRLRERETGWQMFVAATRG